MLIKEVLGVESDVIDNKEGLGSVPKNQEVDYFGMRVLMKPSKFLELAAPGDKPESTQRIMQHLKDGGKIASPFLNIMIPDEWRDGEYTGVARVVGHEGRHRMKAVEQVLNNEPIEVHLFFTAPSREVRARHLNQEMFNALKSGIESQVGRILITNTFLRVL